MYSRFELSQCIRVVSCLVNLIRRKSVQTIARDSYLINNIWRQLRTLTIPRPQRQRKLKKHIVELTIKL